MARRLIIGGLRDKPGWAGRRYDDVLLDRTTTQKTDVSGDVLKLPILSSSFEEVCLEFLPKDLIMSAGLAPFTISEVVRILRPGGKCEVYTGFTPSNEDANLYLVIGLQLMSIVFHPYANNSDMDYCLWTLFKPFPLGGIDARRA